MGSDNGQKKEISDFLCSCMGEDFEDIDLLNITLVKFSICDTDKEMVKYIRKIINGASAFQLKIEKMLEKLDGVVKVDHVKKNKLQSKLKSESIRFPCLDRNHRKHVPDLMIDDIPCELKSPEEIYGACRFSNAHIISYLYQTIYGQCFSYADLFRKKKGSKMSCFLIIPKEITNFKNPDIEKTFKDVLIEENSGIYRRYMNLSKVEFEVPFNLKSKKNYAEIDGKYLATKINYFL